MKNTNIYLVRHGEVKNPKQIIYGRLPKYNLSKLGEFQAQSLKIYFKEIGVDVIYSSPLLRAKETAEIIANGKKIHTDKRLTEIDIKAWEGVEKSKRSKKDVDLYVNHPDQFVKFGETIMDVMERSATYLEDIKKKHKGKNVVVVTHGEVIAAFHVLSGLIMFNQINKTEIRNASITRLELNSALKYERAEYLTVVPAQKDMV